MRRVEEGGNGNGHLKGRRDKPLEQDMAINWDCSCALTSSFRQKWGVPIRVHSREGFSKALDSRCPRIIICSSGGRLAKPFLKVALARSMVSVNGRRGLRYSRTASVTSWTSRGSDSKDCGLGVSLPTRWKWTIVQTRYEKYLRGLDVVPAFVNLKVCRSIRLVWPIQYVKIGLKH